MVSDKMIEALGGRDVTPASTLNQVSGSRKIEEAVQAVVNAAWTKFDPDDESTWPKDNRYYYLDRPKSRPNYMESSTYNEFDVAVWILLEVTRYADPQDLMFKTIGEGQ